MKYKVNFSFGNDENIKSFSFQTKGLENQSNMRFICYTLSFVKTDLFFFLLVSLAIIRGAFFMFSCPKISYNQKNINLLIEYT